MEEEREVEREGEGEAEAGAEVEVEAEAEVTAGCTAGGCFVSYSNNSQWQSLFRCKRSASACSPGDTPSDLVGRMEDGGASARRSCRHLVGKG